MNKTVIDILNLVKGPKVVDNLISSTERKFNFITQSLLIRSEDHSHTFNTLNKELAQKR